MIKKSRVIIDYTDLSDSDLNTKAVNIIKNCSGNTDFEFLLNELANLITDQADYVTRLSEATNGGSIAVGNKNLSRSKLEECIRTICKEINHQQEGNTTALEGSGATLTADSLAAKGGNTPAPTQLVAESCVKPTELFLKVKRFAGLHDHGTMFAVNEAATAPDDINLWPKYYASGHSMTAAGLKAGTKYVVSSAFQGPTGTVLVWCLPVSIWTKAGQ